MQVILDLGSGSTCRNNILYGQHMIDKIAEVDNKKHEIVLKMQLFRDQPPNEHLKKNVFAAMYIYAERLGYKMTASVFDLESLKFLLTFKDLPFIKIACRPDLYWLIGEIPRKIPVYVSCDDASTVPQHENIIELFCVPDYPADIKDYNDVLCEVDEDAVSDHSPGIDLIKEHHNLISIWEKHFKLEDSTGPDAGPFEL
jgi:sialic acid synthase SpsE